MARVTNEMIENYRSASNRINGEVNNATKQVIDALGITKDTDWDELRRMLLDVFSYYGSASSELGRLWYADCRMTEGSDYVPISYFDNSSYGKITKRINEAKEAFDKGEKNDADTAETLNNLLCNYVYKANRDAIIENLNNENAGVKSTTTRTREQQKRDRYYVYKKKKNLYKNKPRAYFMRVPKADCTCAFCIMMASRGAVYHTREKAGGGDPVNLYHLNCRCAVVPVDENDPYIEGYDPDVYLDLYDKALDLLATGELDEQIEQAKATHEKKRDADKSLPQWKQMNEVLIAMRALKDEDLT